MNPPGLYYDYDNEEGEHWWSVRMEPFYAHYTMRGVLKEALKKSNWDTGKDEQYRPLFLVLPGGFI